MSKNSNKQIRPSSGGFFPELTMRIKLIIRLITDPRVNTFIKILPVGSLFYWLVPDLLPGPIDDAGLLFLGTYLFVELCPPAVVEEHLLALGGLPEKSDQEDVVDADFRDVTNR